MTVEIMNNKMRKLKVRTRVVGGWIDVRTFGHWESSKPVVKNKFDEGFSILIFRAISGNIL